jgi:hypothetical protein
MSQGLTQNEQTILKKKNPKDQNLFIFFHLIIKLLDVAGPEDF